MLERRAWTTDERARFETLWQAGSPVSEIGRKLHRTPGGITRARVMFGLPPRSPVFSCIKIKHQEFFFKLPVSRGLEKLLRRHLTLVEWVEEGRDNYEIARSFHVPIRDVETVVARLGLTRPWQCDEPAEEPVRRRQCSVLSCRAWFAAGKFRFRCDDCLAKADAIDASEYAAAVAI
jgi:hypothetical protein